jgi:hypothetical protein
MIRQGPDPDPNWTYFLATEKKLLLKGSKSFDIELFQEFL